MTGFSKNRKAGSSMHEFAQITIRLASLVDPHATEHHREFGRRDRRASVAILGKRKAAKLESFRP